MKIRYKLFLISILFVAGITFTSTLSNAQNAKTHILLPEAVTSTGNSNTQKNTSTPQGQLDVYDHGEPTNEEQYELELINRARSNPPAEGLLLFNTTNPYLIQNRDYWKTPTASDVKTAFATYPSRPPLAFNKDLIAAARRHSQDMLDHNYQAHDSPTDGSSPFTRMEAAGYTGYSFAGENIFAYGSDIDEINQEFEYDFGNPGLGHRENIINFGSFVYREIGIAILHGGTGAPNVGPLVTTEDFGYIGSNVFITGVVYGDDNHNNFYDVGEGLGGVTITVSNGSTTAVSSASGGYAIPFTDQGQVTVTASGGPLTQPISHNVTLEGDNVKVDFILGASGYPEQPIAIAPTNDTTINSDTAHIVWQDVPTEKKFDIQVATDDQMTAIIFKDSTYKSTSKLLPGLKDGMQYFWRVRAKNTIGWGKYSPVQSFKVGLPLKPAALLSPADAANVGSNDVDLKWKDTNPVANDYWVEVSTSKTFATTIRSDTVYLPEDQIPNSELLPDITYYWRVRAENENGWSAPSPVWSFVTGASSVASSSNNPFASIVTPNPTSGETHIKFSVQNTADVSLKVFGLTGLTESTMNLGKLAPNSYDIIWNGNGKPAGVYIYKLTAGDQSETGRIVLVK
jgi:hypothetical protein